MKDWKQETEIKNMISKIDNYSEKINKIILKMQTTDEVSNLYWTKLNVEARKYFTEIKNIYNSKMAKILPKSYYASLINEFEKIKKLKTITNNKAKYEKLKKQNINDFVFTNRNKNTLKILFNNSKSYYNNAVDSGMRSFALLTRTTQQRLIQENEVKKQIATGLEEGANLNIPKSRLELSLLDKLSDGKILTIINKNGKEIHYNASAYAELVTRTQIREAQSMGVINTALEMESDLVKVSSHNTTTPLCQEFEGKIFSISGKNKDFPQADLFPPYHPNCLHSISVVFEEVMKAIGDYDSYSDFSNNLTETPPHSPSFIPVKEREEK